jgi:hypothetical protein
MGFTIGVAVGMAAILHGVQGTVPMPLSNA